MKKRFRGIRVFLILALVFSILALPAYRRYNKSPRIGSVRFNLAFEISDQEEELSNKQKESKGFGPTAFLTVFLLVTKLLDQSFDLFPLLLSLHQETPILRC